MWIYLWGGHQSSKPGKLCKYHPGEGRSFGVVLIEPLLSIGGVLRPLLWVWFYLRYHQTLEGALRRRRVPDNGQEAPGSAMSLIPE